MFKIVTKQTQIKLISYSKWYLIFFFIGLCSLFYANNKDFVLGDAYSLFVCWILVFSFIQFIQGSKYFVRILLFYAYSPIIFIIYLLINGDWSSTGERLGQSSFGNANNLALVMMVSVFCITWFVVYAKNKFQIINIILAFIYLYVITLTGGRKFLLIPFIFLFLLLILKFRHEKKPGTLFFILIFVLVSLISIWSVINIPALYNSIGIRYVGLINFINGDFANADASTIIRFTMIENGFKWFVEKPILGYGLNNYQGEFSKLLMGYSYAHNNYIELMVDLGLIGVIGYYFFYVFIIRKLISIQNDSIGLRSFFLAFMMVLLIFEVGAVTYNLYLLQIFIGLASAFVWSCRINNGGF